MSDTCKWIGDGEKCGKVAVNGRSYCEDHIWIVYQKGSAQGRRKKDQRIADNVRLVESLFNEAVEELVNEGFDL